MLGITNGFDGIQRFPEGIFLLVDFPAAFYHDLQQG